MFEMVLTACPTRGDMAVFYLQWIVMRNASSGLGLLWEPMEICRARGGLFKKNNINDISEYFYESGADEKELFVDIENMLGVYL